MQTKIENNKDKQKLKIIKTMFKVLLNPIRININALIPGNGAKNLMCKINSQVHESFSSNKVEK